MKIVANISEGNFMVEANWRELNTLSGLKKDYSTRSYGGDVFKTGDEFNILETWEYLYGILAKKEQLEALARNLRSMADMIESMPAPTTSTLEKNNETQ
jgi:hypothetical protein